MIFETNFKSEPTMFRLKFVFCFALSNGKNIFSAKVIAKIQGF